MSHKINDIELASNFTKEIYEDYCFALEFIKHNPDYSLLKFRQIIENLLCEIAKVKKIDFESNSIHDRIEYLFQTQIIHKDFKDKLHLIRKLCNGAIHKNSNFEQKNLDDKDFYNKNKKMLMEKAYEAQEIVIKIFIDTAFITVNKIFKLTDVQFVDIKQQEFKDILFQGITEVDYKKKLIAGIACESIIKEQSFNTGLIVSSDFAVHKDSLDNIINNLFDSACKISANLDHHLDENNKELTITRYASVEALYKYASNVLSMEYIKENPYSIAWRRLAAAASRGYPSAQGLYGAYLYELRKYEESLKYLLEAQSKDDVMALRFLYHYYSDVDSTTFDKALAIRFLEKAIDLGCPDALATLGIAYHKGIIFDKNDNEANKYLEHAISKGSVIGFNYYRWEFKYNREKFVNDVQSIANLFAGVLEGHTKELRKNIGRNDKCFCGSNKKYKKCCMV